MQRDADYVSPTHCEDKRRGTQRNLTSRADRPSTAGTVTRRNRGQSVGFMLRSLDTASEACDEDMQDFMAAFQETLDN